MIPVILRDLVPRLVLLAVAMVGFYFLEPAFHQHDTAEADLTAMLGPPGLSATLAYLGGFATIVLLAGFISTSRERGYARILFSHPTRPATYYAVRWLVALLLALGAAAVFLVIGQLVAWGEFRGGWLGLALAGAVVLVYGGLMAFLSAALPRGDAWVALVLFVPTFLPQVLVPLQRALAPGLYQLLLFGMPPQTTAFQGIFDSVLAGRVALAPMAFAVGYGLFWLVAGWLVLRVREWG